MIFSDEEPTSERGGRQWGGRGRKCVGVEGWSGQSRRVGSWRGLSSYVFLFVFHWYGWTARRSALESALWVCQRGRESERVGSFSFSLPFSCFSLSHPFAYEFLLLFQCWDALFSLCLSCVVLCCHVIRFFVWQAFCFFLSYIFFPISVFLIDWNKICCFFLYFPFSLSATVVAPPRRCYSFNCHSMPSFASVISLLP